MTVSRRVANLGLGAAVFVLLGSMMIVFIGSTHGKTPPQENAQPSSYTQSPDSSPSRAN